MASLLSRDLVDLGNEEDLSNPKTSVQTISTPSIILEPPDESNKRHSKKRKNSQNSSSDWVFVPFEENDLNQRRLFN